MRALSIRQPWAEFILTGEKDIEYRSWKTNHLSDLIVQASNTKKGFLAQRRFSRAFDEQVFG